jgi:transposase
MQARAGYKNSLSVTINASFHCSTKCKKRYVNPRRFIRTPSKRVHEILGVGEITASAVVATVGNATDFKNGRQFAAWLGLVPTQYSTGGNIKMGRITKQGDQHLRTLLVHGARTVLINAGKRSGRISQWATQLIVRRGFHKACIAMAAKNARIIWAVLARGEAYRPDHIVTMA